MSKSIVKHLEKAYRRVGSGNQFVDLGDTSHVKVTGFSRSATPGDLRRLCVRSGVENIAAVSINYKGFHPQQEGFISFTHPSFVRNAIKSLRHSIMGGYTVTVEPSASPDEVPHSLRSRGFKGRAEAAERGIVAGDGAGAGISKPGKSVLMYGLPPQISAPAMKRYLQDYMQADSGEKEIVRIEEEKGAITSRYLIRLANASEAHRLVRQFHMTSFTTEAWGKKFKTKVRVIA
ncbi:hypothetical protein EUX98_g274 [Antrodiella citrinella]|uniref:RRM domain-containing protein n=1 Tax=Antrodiella citrinella TaxID=2447956 RepID=A0A4S4N488_9APHY|nr:hypothetical protein EUX98_g274 [Antrodiella citrinella]